MVHIRSKTFLSNFHHPLGDAYITTCRIRKIDSENERAFNSLLAKTESFENTARRPSEEILGTAVILKAIHTATILYYELFLWRRLLDECSATEYSILDVYEKIELPTFCPCSVIDHNDPSTFEGEMGAIPVAVRLQLSEFTRKLTVTSPR